MVLYSFSCQFAHYLKRTSIELSSLYIRINDQFVCNFLHVQGFYNKFISFIRFCPLCTSFKNFKKKDLFQVFCPLCSSFALYKKAKNIRTCSLCLEYFLHSHPSYFQVQVFTYQLILHSLTYPHPYPHERIQYPFILYKFFYFLTHPHARLKSFSTLNHLLSPLLFYIIIQFLHILPLPLSPIPPLPPLFLTTTSLYLKP